jgi:hypothetical protein
MSSSPLFRIIVPERSSEERRAVRRRLREVEEHDPGLRPKSRTLLIVHPLDPEGFVPQSNRGWNRLFARLFASSLDRQLASGGRPESSRMMASRAEQLVMAPLRWSLGQSWLDLLERAHQPSSARDPHVAPCRDGLLRAEGDVHTMVEALVSTLPTPARGVAMSACLLADGAGPAYDRRCGTDLRASLREVTARLDPTISLAERS